MAAYSYPITINRTKQTVSVPFTKTLDQDALTSKLIQSIAGNNSFDIERDNYNQYVITVYATRIETNAEYNTRITKAESYMAEYNRRKTAK